MNTLIARLEGKLSRFLEVYVEQEWINLIAYTGCGETRSFGDGYAYIYGHIQEERLCFIYKCGVRHVLFEEVLTLVA